MSDKPVVGNLMFGPLTVVGGAAPAPNVRIVTLQTQTCTHTHRKTVTTKPGTVHVCEECAQTWLIPYPSSSASGGHSGR